MEQDIRFCPVGGRRVAYASAGAGPLLVLPTWWISHLEEDWASPDVRAFIEALAESHTVVRYDRLGTGLSDREPEPDLASEVRTLQAVIEHLADGPVRLLGTSVGGCFAAAYSAGHPDRVERVALIGAYPLGSEIAPEEVRRALPELVRAHWGIGSRTLADIFVPGGAAADHAAFADFQRASADAETAARLLEAVYRYDVRDLLPSIRTPTLVIHRRDDRAIPYAAGRELAALIPDARLVAVDGDVHLPWYGDSGAVLRPLADFLGVPPPELAVEDAPADGRMAGDELTDRELDVLRLVAEGLSDFQIAERLILSPHTVHRHVANIRTKLREPSRAAAVAHAARAQLI